MTITGTGRVTLHSAPKGYIRAAPRDRARHRLGRVAGPQADPASVIAVVLTAASPAGAGSGPGRHVERQRDGHQSFRPQPIGSVTRNKVPGSETVMRMLERSFKVRTRYGGGFVQSIDGASGSARRGATGSTTSTGSRPSRRGEHGGARGRPDLVGPARLDRDGSSTRPSWARFPSRSCTGSAAGGCRRRSNARPTCRTRASGSRRSSRRPACPSPRSCSGQARGRTRSAVLVGTWADLRGAIAAQPDRPRAAVQRGLRAVHQRRQLAGAARPARPVGSHAGRRRGTGRGDRDRDLRADLARHRHRCGRRLGGRRRADAEAAADHFALAVQGQTDLPVPLQGAQ